MTIDEKVIALENGVLDPEATIVLIQELIDDGIVWQLSDAVVRTARDLIERGECVSDG